MKFNLALISMYIGVFAQGPSASSTSLPSEAVVGIDRRVSEIIDFGVDVGRKTFPPDAYEFARIFERGITFEAVPQPLTPAEKQQLRDIIDECETNPQPAQANFVKVTEGEFCFKDEEFLFIGFNSYQIVRFQLFQPQAVDNLLSRAQEIGLKVARIWLFSDNIHPGPFQWDETVMQAIDAIIQKAASYDIKIVFAFANYWEHFLGAEQYVYWSQGTLEGKNIRDFYEDEGSQLLYMAHVCKMVNRVNSITGVRWRDEPTIMAWNLMNEPRCPACDTTKWIRDMAAFVKSIDPNHLVSTGMEGFTQSSSSIGYFDNVGQWPICQGTDFVFGHSSADIDYATMHIYPEHIGWDFETNIFCDVECQDLTSQTYYEARLEEATTVLKKPLVLEETGMSVKQSYRQSNADGTFVEKEYTRQQRVQFYKALLGSMLSGIERGDNVGGFMFWMAITDNYPDYDGFSIALDESISFEARVAVDFQLLQTFRNKDLVEECIRNVSDWRPNPIVPLPVTIPVTGDTVVEVLENAIQQLQLLQQNVSTVTQQFESGSIPDLTAEDCTNIPPSDDFTCQQQKRFGKCNYTWMIQGKFCLKECDRCDLFTPRESVRMPRSPRPSSSTIRSPRSPRLNSSAIRTPRAPRLMNRH